MEGKAKNESAAQDNANSCKPKLPPNDPAVSQSPPLPKGATLEDCETEFRLVIPNLTEVFVKGEPVLSEHFSVAAFKDNLRFQLLFEPNVVRKKKHKSKVPTPGTPLGTSLADNNNNNNNNNNGHKRQKVNKRKDKKKRQKSSSSSSSSSFSILNQFARITLRTLVHCAEEIDCTVHYQISALSCHEEEEVSKSRFSLII